MFKRRVDPTDYLGATGFLISSILFQKVFFEPVRKLDPGRNSNSDKEDFK